MFCLFSFTPLSLSNWIRRVVRIPVVVIVVVVGVNIIDLPVLVSLCLGFSVIVATPKVVTRGERFLRLLFFIGSLCALGSGIESVVCTIGGS